MIKIALFIGIVVAIGWAIIVWMASRLQRMNEGLRQQEEDFVQKTLQSHHPVRSSSSPTEPAQAEDVISHTASPLSISPTPSGISYVLEYEKRLEAAGLLSQLSGDDLIVPGVHSKGRIVRLANNKQMAIIPEDSPVEWIDSALRLYDSVLIASAGQAKVLRRFEDFLADQLFH